MGEDLERADGVIVSKIDCDRQQKIAGLRLVRSYRRDLE